jgi:hypothetical protein
VDNIELSFDKADGSNPPAFYTTGGGTARIYKGTTMSIYAGGATITKIVFTYSTNVTPAFSTGNYDTPTQTWEGEATNLTLINAYTTNTQIRIKSMTVYYSAASAAGDNIAGNVLKGAKEDIDAPCKYILDKPENKKFGFYLATTGTIKAGKAYLEVPDGTDIKAYYFTDDDATDIKNLNDTKDSNDAIYNLAGQRLNKMQKGINIVNGKKILK